jgi:hypothetical protein
MTKTQARKRINEARAKIMAVWNQQNLAGNAGDATYIRAIQVQDLIAFEKMFDKIMKRLR